MPIPVPRVRRWLRVEGDNKMNVILNLTIKRKWFDMIASGEKREEYRSMDNAQVRNAFERMQDYPCSYSMILRNGYRMDSPAVVARLTNICIWHSASFPGCGEPNYPHYAISFDKILSRGTYAEVKRWLERGGNV